MKKLPFANALAFVAGLIYVVCALGIAFARDLYFAFLGSFFHGIDLAALPSKEITLSGAITGFIAIVITAWVLGYIFARCYNWCDKKFAK